MDDLELISCIMLYLPVPEHLVDETVVMEKYRIKAGCVVLTHISIWSGLIACGIGFTWKDSDRWIEI